MYLLAQSRPNALFMPNMSRTRGWPAACTRYVPRTAVTCAASCTMMSLHGVIWRWGQARHDQAFSSHPNQPLLDLDLGIASLFLCFLHAANSPSLPESVLGPGCLCITDITPGSETRFSLSVPGTLPRPREDRHRQLNLARQTDPSTLMHCGRGAHTPAPPSLSSS